MAAKYLICEQKLRMLVTAEDNGPGLSGQAEFCFA